MAPRVDIEDISKAHLARINDLAICRRNFDTPCANDAARNLIEGKPAYWYFGRSSAASHVAPAANAKGSLIAALATFSETHIHVGIAEDVLDRLIPLNLEAIEEMELAYRLQSTFRERDELVNREREAIMSPYYPAAGLTLSTRVQWAEEYELCHERFVRRHALPVSAASSLAIVSAAHVL